MDPQPSAGRWHLIGLTGYLAMLGIYAAGGGTRLRWLLAAAAVLGGFALLLGWLLGWLLGFIIARNNLP